MLDNLLEPSFSEENETVNEELETEQPEVTDEEAADKETLGEESDATEETEEEGDDTFVIGDKEYTVERIQELESSELRQADYTKKTQALAAERKQVTALVDTLNDTISEFESSIDSEESALQELLDDGDTEGYIRQENLIKQKRKKLKEAKAKKQEAEAEIQAQEGKTLYASMTAWHDPKTGAAQQKADIDAAMKYAESIGHTNETLSKISDHRMIRALIDAGRKQSAPSVQAKVKKKAAKKVVSRKSPGQKKQKSIVDLFYGSK